MKKALFLIFALVLLVSISVPVNADIAEYKTEDVYLLGDGEGTRMAPAVFWDRAFTGTSAELCLGKEVTVWHFPANAMLALDNWGYMPKLIAVYKSDDNGDGVFEETPALETYHFEGREPFCLPCTDIIYILSLYEYDFTTDDTKLCKEYYVMADGDKTVSEWAKEEINSARVSGLIPALTDAPAYSDAITREQFAELVVRLVEKCGIYVDAGESSFADCDSYAVLQAATVGIVNGVGDGKFAPKQTANREQIATMLHRAINHIKVAQLTNCNPIPLSGSIENYADKAEVSDWAAEGVGALAANGIMKGTSDTTLSPKNPCTVEQCIILIYRLYTKYTAN